MSRLAERLAALCCASFLGLAAHAQDTAPAADAATAEGLAMGISEEVEVGQTYVREEHGDWQVRCVRAAEGDDPCNLYQLLRDSEGNSVAEISVFSLPPGNAAAAGATIITPLETLLTQQILLDVDGGTAKRYPFTFCNQVGCFARVGFTEDEVAAFRAGSVANMVIVPAAAPNQTVDLTISLVGFTAGLAAVTPE